MVLIGNKSDLIAERNVRPEQGLDLANQFSNYTRNFFETSAKGDDSCEDVFIEIIRQIETSKEIAAKFPTNVKQKKCTIL